jgi:hypothetical protein
LWRLWSCKWYQRFGGTGRTPNFRQKKILRSFCNDRYPVNLSQRGATFLGLESSCSHSSCFLS